jgi:hypothetical protein
MRSDRAPGFPLTRASLDSQVGNLIVTARDGLDACSAFLLRFESVNASRHQDLLDAGYTEADIALINGGFFGIDALNKVGHAGALPGGPNDFWFQANQMIALR